MVESCLFANGPVFEWWPIADINKQHFWMPSLFVFWVSVYQMVTLLETKKPLIQNPQILSPLCKTEKISTGSFSISVVYFDQMLVKCLYKTPKNKKCWKRLKKGVRPTFGCAQHPKVDRNTQHISPLNLRSWLGCGWALPIELWVLLHLQKVVYGWSKKRPPEEQSCWSLRRTRDCLKQKETG